MICFIAFLGFCLENAWIMLRKGYIDNRNMNLPFLLGYGLMVIGIYIIIGTPKTNVLSYFMTTFILVSIGEIILGKSVEKLCGIYYWDYTTLPLHVTRYTSFFTSIGFSFIITGFMDTFFIKIMDGIHNIESVLFDVLTVIMFIMLVVDFIYSFRYMIIHKDFYDKWKRSVNLKIVVNLKQIRNRKVL